MDGRTRELKAAFARALGESPQAEFLLAGSSRAGSSLAGGSVPRPNPPAGPPATAQQDSGPAGLAAWRRGVQPRSAQRRSAQRRGAVRHLTERRRGRRWSWLPGSRVMGPGHGPPEGALAEDRPSGPGKHRPVPEGNLCGPSWGAPAWRGGCVRAGRGMGVRKRLGGETPQERPRRREPVRTIRGSEAGAARQGLESKCFGRGARPAGTTRRATPAEPRSAVPRATRRCPRQEGRRAPRGGGRERAGPIRGPRFERGPDRPVGVSRGVRAGFSPVSFESGGADLHARRRAGAGPAPRPQIVPSEEGHCTDTSHGRRPPFHPNRDPR